MKIPLPLARVEATHHVAIDGKGRIQDSLVDEGEVALWPADLIRGQRKSDDRVGGVGKQVGVDNLDAVKRIALGPFELNVID